MNVSRGGALVEAPTRLAPGTRVVVLFFGPAAGTVLVSRVTRAHVAAVDGQRVQYQGAIAFDECLELLEEANRRFG